MVRWVAQGIAALFKPNALLVAENLRLRQQLLVLQRRYIRGQGWRMRIGDSGILHAGDIWACDFFCVQTIFFRTFYVFFVIHHASREVLHVQVTRHPTADWAVQQIVKACAWDQKPPPYLIHDRDSRYGVTFDRRLQRLGIRQTRTLFRSPQVNSIAERWVRSARTECLDHMSIFNECHLRRVLREYVT